MSFSRNGKVANACLFTFYVLPHNYLRFPYRSFFRPSHGVMATKTVLGLLSKRMRKEVLLKNVEVLRDPPYCSPLQQLGNEQARLYLQHFVLPYLSIHDKQTFAIEGTDAWIPAYGNDLTTIQTSVDWSEVFASVVVQLACNAMATFEVDSVAKLPKRYTAFKTGVTLPTGSIIPPPLEYPFIVDQQSADGAMFILRIILSHRVVDDLLRLVIFRVHNQRFDDSIAQVELILWCLTAYSSPTPDYLTVHNYQHYCPRMAGSPVIQTPLWFPEQSVFPAHKSTSFAERTTSGVSIIIPDACYPATWCNEPHLLWAFISRSGSTTQFDVWVKGVASRINSAGVWEMLFCGAGLFEYVPAEFKAESLLDFYRAHGVYFDEDEPELAEFNVLDTTITLCDNVSQKLHITTL